MVKLKFKINLFDLLAVVSIIIVILMVGLGIYNKPYLGSKTLAIDIRVSSATAIATILPKVKTGNSVFYNGTKYPVQQVSYRTEQDTSGKIINLYITLKGPGDINDGKSIFNGQRIYLNQKAEVIADYSVLGYVTDFRYAD